MSIYKKAGERIFLMRVMRGYTRECLAEKAQISPKFLYEIETGRKGFSAIVLYHLSVALQVDCDYIMTGKESATGEQQLLEVIKLFDQSQTERLLNILKQIHELL